MKRLIICLCAFVLFAGVADAADPAVWTRTHIEGGSWWYNPYLDMNILAGGPINVNTSTWSMDIRGHQNTYDYQTVNDNGTPADLTDDFLNDPVTRTAFQDCNVFLRAYDYSSDGLTLNGWRDYSIIWATQTLGGDPLPPYTGGEPGDTWTTRSFAMGDPTSQVFSDTDYSGNIFDATSVDRIRLYGTDWEGNKGYDHALLGTSFPNTFGDYMDWANLLVTGPGGTLVNVTMGDSAGGGIYGDDRFVDYITFEVIPEPGTMALMGLGLLSLLGVRRKK